MDEADSRRIKDVESLKMQLKNTKQMIEETVKKNDNLKNDLKEGKLQFSRTLNNLQKIQSGQSLRLSKLNADTKNFESMCMSQAAEKNNLIDTINQLNEKLETLKIESERKIEENRSLCLAKDKEVKCSFVKFQNDQEIVVLWELGQNLSSEEEDEAFKKVFFKTKAETDRRFENFVKELTDLDDALMKLREEIRIRRDQLNTAEEKHRSLKCNYKVVMPKDAEIDAA